MKTWLAHSWSKPHSESYPKHNYSVIKKTSFSKTHLWTQHTLKATPKKTQKNPQHSAKHTMNTAHMHTLKTTQQTHTRSKQHNHTHTHTCCSRQSHEEFVFGGHVGQASLIIHNGRVRILRILRSQSFFRLIVATLESRAEDKDEDDEDEQEEKGHGHCTTK